MISSRQSFQEYVEAFLEESEDEPDSVEVKLDYENQEGYLEINLDEFEEDSNYPEVEYLGHLMIEELGIKQPTILSFSDKEEGFYQAKVE